MRRAAKLVVTFSGIAVAVSAVSVWLAPRAIAQVRAALVKDVDHPANAPFAWEVISLASSTNQVPHGSFTVPSTAEGRPVQRLVVEAVTALCSNLSSPAAGIRVTGPTPTPGLGSLVPEFFAPFVPGPEPASNAVHVQTRLYINPGATANINVLEVVSFGVCSFSMSGHFVLQ